MNDKQIETVIDLLSRIAFALESQVRSLGPIEPNLVRSLSEYALFDWSSIGARVVQSDPSGPTHVEHDGALYTRRSPQNKYGAAIWFSRSVGRDEEGGAQYIRLITFKILGDADPLPASVQREMAYTLSMSQKTYLAKAHDYSIEEAGARAIAQLVNEDYAQAARLLPFFAHCKTRGITRFADARRILEACNGDPIAATRKVESDVDEIARAKVITPRLPANHPAAH